MAMAARSHVPIRFVPELRPGISHARNTCIARAAGRCLALLDDDEEAEPQWLAHLPATIERYGADAVVGPVYPRYPAGAPDIDPYRRRVYTRDARAPTGTPLLRWNIGNSRFDKGRCFVDAEPFSPRLGRTGGEDTVFLCQLTRHGCKMVWCAEAVPWETVPVDRLGSDYRLRRAFRGAQTTTFCLRGDEAPRIGPRPPPYGGGCVQVALYGPATLALKALGHEGWLALMAKAVAGLGELLWHPSLHLRMYR
jgi:succinoglycan biosynthesis protein ExoM